jgi:hypothetical protein
VRSTRWYQRPSELNLHLPHSVRHSPNDNSSTPAQTDRMARQGGYRLSRAHARQPQCEVSPYEVVHQRLLHSGSSTLLGIPHVAGAEQGCGAGIRVLRSATRRRPQDVLQFGTTAGGVTACGKSAGARRASACGGTRRSAAVMETKRVNRTNPVATRWSGISAALRRRPPGRPAPRGDLSAGR